MIRTETINNEEVDLLLRDVTANSEKPKKLVRTWSSIYILLGLVMFILAFIAHGLLRIFLLIVGVIFIYCAMRMGKIQKDAYLKNITRNKKDAPEKLCYDFDYDGAHGAISHAYYSWDAMSCYGEHSHYLWIQLRDYKCLVVDKNNNDYAAVENLLNENHVLKKD